MDHTERCVASSVHCPGPARIPNPVLAVSIPILRLRLSALDDTRPLFPLGAVVAFTAGLTATIAYESIVVLLSTFFTDAFDLRFLAGLVFVPLAVGVVGVAIWREAFAAHAEGREPASPWVDGTRTGGRLPSSAPSSRWTGSRGSRTRCCETCLTGRV